MTLLVDTEEIPWSWWMGPRPLTEEQLAYITPGTERLAWDSALPRGSHRPAGRRCGTWSGYVGGCRCEECKEASRSRSRRRRAAPPHLCHAIDCQTAVPEKLLMCSRHWAMVPKPLKKAVWAHYIPGQVITKTPTTHYLAAAQAAIQAVASKQRSRNALAADAGEQGTLLLGGIRGGESDEG